MKSNWVSLFAILGILLSGIITGQQLVFADDDNEIKVEIEIEDGIAEIKVQTEDDEYEFELGTTNIEEIIEIIQLRTGLSKDAIKDVMDIEINDESNESDDDQFDEDKSRDIQIDTSEHKIRVSTLGDQSEVKIELEFIIDTLDIDEIIDEILDRFELTNEQAENELKIQEADDELEEKFKVEIEIEDGIAEVEVELRYILDTSDKDAILDSIVNQSQLTREQINNTIDIETHEEDDTSDRDLSEQTSDTEMPHEQFSDEQNNDTLREENEALRQENQMLKDEIEQLQKRLANMSEVIMEQIRVMMDTLTVLRLQ